MELMARARALEAEGRDIIHMEVGEPDFPTPEPIVAAAQAQHRQRPRVLHASARTARIACVPSLLSTTTRYGISIPASRIVVTAGASGALLLAMACLAEPGSEWLLSDPGYPCNRISCAASKDDRSTFRSAREQLSTHPGRSRSALDRTLRPVFCWLRRPTPPAPCSMTTNWRPSPTFVRQRQGQLIVDEIYHGLTYERDAQTALQFGDDIFVVQSFSKYFNMTGWRLGWLVVPERFVRDIEKLAQNLFISPSTPAQHAALAAFSPATISILEARRGSSSAGATSWRQRWRLGFRQAAKPEGAFYLYANCSELTDNSDRFARDLLDGRVVAITPGLDFGSNAPEKHLRFAYTTRCRTFGRSGRQNSPLSRLRLLKTVLHWHSIAMRRRSAASSGATSRSTPGAASRSRARVGLATWSDIAVTNHRLYRVARTRRGAGREGDVLRRFERQLVAALEFDTQRKVVAALSPARKTDRHARHAAAGDELDQLPSRRTENGPRPASY
jgi:aspartate/methionine/tyrosine aminotransferase